MRVVGTDLATTHPLKNAPLAPRACARDAYYRHCRPTATGLSRAAYARKVFVGIKTGYLMKRASKLMGDNNQLGKIKFLNYVMKRRFFVLTGTTLAYHHDHKNLDDSLNSKVCVNRLVFGFCCH